VALPSDIYDRGYFLSDRCEGYEYFQEGDLSLVKRGQVERLGPEAGMRVLDAGCGRGEVLLACARQGAAVAGVDYSEDAVDLTRETLADYPDSDIRHGDVTRLPWPDDSYDRILFGDVIEHLEARQADAALRELRRVLRPGGMVLVHTAPNLLFRKAGWPVSRLLLLGLGKGPEVKKVDDYLEDVKRYHINEQTIYGLRRAMSRAGFDRSRVWIDRNVARSGSHRLTRGIADNGAIAAGAQLAAARPLRLFLGNDLYAAGWKTTG
jgi:ubiquinone/menaquinone biosynthesis C-methylase UbiE